MLESKTRLLHEPANWIEAEAISAELEAAGILVVIVRHADTALPGVTDRNRGWGEIRVPDERFDEAEGVLERTLGDLPDDASSFVEEQYEEAESKSVNGYDPSEKSAPPRASASIITVLLGISVACNITLGYWNYTAQSSLGDSVVDDVDAQGRLTTVNVFEGNAQFAVRTTCYDTRGREIGVYEDRDEDNRPEVYRTLHEGSTVTIWRDTDEDGIYEEAETAGADGLRQVMHDVDDDQRMDRAEIFRGAEMTAVLTDTNDSGIFDLATRVVSGERTTSRLRDTTSDGFFDSASCTGANGNEISVDLMSCIAHID